MKFLKYFSLFLIVGLVNAMHNDVVVNPYQPSFSARHSNFVSNVKASGLAAMAGIATVGLQKKLESRPNNLINPLNITVATFAAVKLFDTSKSNLIDTILIDPNSALKYAYSVNDKFEGEAKKIGIEKADTLPKYEELVRKYEQHCPIFLLGECTQEGWGHCVLSRDYCHQYRKEFETVTSNALLKKIKDKNDELNYTSFGSGGAFQELVILTKTLSKKPDAKITIHLIDHKYTPYAISRDFLSKTRELNDEDYDLTQAMPDLIYHAQKNWGAGSIAAAEIENGIKINYATTQTSKRQIIEWLKKTFPQATLSLHLHNTAGSYIDYLDKNNIAYPDVVTAADIQDEMSLLHSSVKDYDELCYKALQKKPDSNNIFLTKDQEKIAGSLLTVSLEPVSDLSVLDTIEVSEKEEPVYITVSPIGTSWWNRIFKK